MRRITTAMSKSRLLLVSPGLQILLQVAALTWAFAATTRFQRLEGRVALGNDTRFEAIAVTWPLHIATWCSLTLVIVATVFAIRRRWFLLAVLQPLVAVCTWLAFLLFGWGALLFGAYD
jgi:hypothetical protein